MVHANKIDNKEFKARTKKRRMVGTVGTVPTCVHDLVIASYFEIKEAGTRRFTAHHTSNFETPIYDDAHECFGYLTTRKNKIVIKMRKAGLLFECSFPYKSFTVFARDSRDRS